MSFGVLKAWVSARGFGFIMSDNPAEADTFVHIKEFQRAGLEASEGMRLEYDLAPGRVVGRMMAVNLRAADEQAEAA